MHDIEENILFNRSNNGRISTEKLKSRAFDLEI